MRKKRENRKYRTHPLVGAALALSLLLAAAVCAASYGFYRYVKKENEATLDMRSRCAYEAYLSLCESLGRRETESAAEALSRCKLFGGCGEADDLCAAIMSGNVSRETAEELRRALDGSVSVYEAVMRADAAAGRALKAEEGDGGAPRPRWETLAACAEITDAEAHKLAADTVGGGVTLTRAENHTFPLVYTYTCKNAAADITRAGGKLLRMYVYRHGGARIRSGDECRRSAESFVKEAGIHGCVLISEEETPDGYDYVFCGTFSLMGTTVTCPEERIVVGVSRDGGGISFFDASGYYEMRPVTYELPEMRFRRTEAAGKLGVDEGYLTLVYIENRLFWRLGGVKTLLLDAETGEIRAQNP